jgi:hypothetical protein
MKQDEPLHAELIKAMGRKQSYRNKQSNQQFEVANRVFHRFYIGEVRPIMVELHQQSREFFGFTDRLQAA